MATMQSVVNRNLLKHAAGTAMFCPQCSTCMDFRRTVLVTSGSATLTMCASCWDRAKELIKPDVLARCDVVDGRTA
jgi:uncharacterized Zn finger protein